MCVSSGIKGLELECVYPKDPSKASPYETRHSLRHVIFTAETHNFPTGQDNQSTLCLLAIGVFFFPLLWFSKLIITNPDWPPGVAPFSGATTGTGGRIRDVQSAGKGGHVIAGTAGYCFGNLHIPGLQKTHNMLLFLLWECEMVLKSVIYPSSLSIAPGYVLPWESSGEGWEYPSSFAPPLQVAVEASDGASDYGNKFGEPVLSGRELY